MWLIFAFSGPITWAISTHIDKYLIDKYFKNSDTTVSMVFTSIIGLLMLPFIWIYDPKALNIPVLSILVMVMSGILYVGAMLFYLRAIQSAEASVVAPLFQTSIIFTFVLGYIVLGETLSWVNALGAALIILGALALSLDASFHIRKINMRVLVLMLICTFVLAFSAVMFKFFAVRDEFWSTVFWTYAGEALFGFGIISIPRYFKQFFLLIKTNTKALLSVNAANELINLGGSLGVRFASLLAPVALVSAISSTTTLFVFLFGILLTMFLPKLVHEDLSRSNLIQKGIAALLVTVGVVLANIS